ncbi:MAG TPA: BamA/TamA family outer membrane protein [Chitinophagaceae bacterium]
MAEKAASVRKQEVSEHKCRLMRWLTLCCCLMMMQALMAQEKQPGDKENKKALLHDTLDGKLDFSHFLIDPKGFIPIPFIITEPALGGFGGLLVPMFIKPGRSVNGKGYAPPDITALAAMYTVNNSWVLGAFRSASIPKWSMKYRAAAGYGSINLAFYRELPSAGEKKFSFNITTLPVMVSLSKKISKQDIYIGLQYLHLNSKVKPEFDEPLPDFIKQEELDNQTASLGVFMDWDRRNSIFTPDKGARLYLLGSADDQWTGSDFTYQRVEGALNWFVPVKANWISGLRTEIQHVFNEPPFYLLPYISLRGVPIARYQGATTVLLETEQRIDLNLRWSVVGFGGLGKAIERNESFDDAQTVYNIGTGFRYLIARIFRIRAGIDIAKGPDSFGYYIVFGHNWNR